MKHFLFSLIFSTCMLVAGISAHAGLPLFLENQDTTQIRIGGSSVLSKQLSQVALEYETAHPETKFVFHGGGSLIGQKQLVAGAVDIACSDVGLAVDDDGQRIEEMVWDKIPVVFIVHPDLGITDIQRSNLKAIFAGTITNWKEIGGPDQPIRIISRGDFSGTRNILSQTLPAFGLDHPAKVAATSSKMVSLVATIPGTLGYVDHLSLPATLQGLRIDGVVPSQKSLEQKTYTFGMTGRIMFRKDAPDHIRSFLDFAKEWKENRTALSALPAPATSPAIQTKPPIELVGIVLAGIGLFLVGVRFVSTSMKKMANRNMRALFCTWTGNRFLAALWGMLSGAISQSGTSSSFLLTSLVSGGMIPLENALFILTWVDVGTTLLVFLATFDIHTAILYFLAISGLLYSFDKKNKRTFLLTALLGMAMLLFGLGMIKSSSVYFAGFVWVQELMTLGADHPWLLFVLGAGLRVVTQSSSTVAMLVMPLAMSGISTLSQSLLMIYGTCVGSGLAALLLSGNIAGTPRQVILFKALGDFAGAAIMTMLLLVESLGHLPLVVRVLEMAGQEVNQQVALGFLLTKLVPTGLMLACSTPLIRLIRRLSPSTAEETLSRLAFVKDQISDNPETTMDLIALESGRILKRLPGYLAPYCADAGREQTDVAPESLHSAALELNTELQSVLTEVFEQDLSRENAEDLLVLQNRQQTLMTLEQAVFDLTEAIAATQDDEQLASLASAITEGIHMLLMTAADLAVKRHEEDRNLLLMMSGDRSGLMEQTRKTYLSGENRIPADRRPQLLRLTNLAQRTVWLINKWAR
jgi:phosphate:Na+ symporter